jgi:Rieske 2Fe-2S family protein
MLKHACPTLPASNYYDPNHYLRELESIWWKEWLCVARRDEWSEPGQFQVFNIGGQQIIVVLADSGDLRAFHNTCRHRGAELCQAAAGALHQNRIVCPYHAWQYSLDGDLVGTPRRVDTDDFDPDNYSLYPAMVECWAGFVFINLARQPGALADSLSEYAHTTKHWPLADLALAHNESHDIACNWKVFWENFLECYHCPKVHPDLCRLVPLYGKGLNSTEELDELGENPESPSNARLRPGAVTWTQDGQSQLPWFEGLSTEEQARGVMFSVALPGFYLAAHVDYVRSVHVMPLAPEKTRLTINWLLMPETLASQSVDTEALTALGRQVVLEDAAICEINQRGLHSIRHDAGVLIAQEHDVLAFHDWLRDRLGPSETMG